MFDVSCFPFCRFYQEQERTFMWVSIGIFILANVAYGKSESLASIVKSFFPPNYFSSDIYCLGIIFMIAFIPARTD